MANTDLCPSGWHPNSDLTKCVKNAASKVVTFPEIAAAYVVANDRPQISRILIENGVVTPDMVRAMSDKQLVSVLVSYYIKNGGIAYNNLLSQFTPNRNTKNWTTNQQVLTATTADLRAAGVISSNPSARADWFNEAWNGLKDAILGSTTSTTAPVVVSTTTASPTLIAAILGGVLVFAIVAYAILKS